MWTLEALFASLKNVQATFGAPDWRACTALRRGQSKQIWVSVKIPQSALPGTYRGTITAHTVGTSHELNSKLRFLN